MTRPTRRSPRLAIPSANVAAGSCHFTCAARALGRVAQQRDLAPQLVDAVLTEPLERRVRLRHEPAERHRATGLLRVLAADVDHVLGERRDAERVFVHLGGQPGEEVELHPPPTLRVRGVDRGVEVVFDDELVDHLPQPPRTGLGRERETGAAHLLDLARDADAERVDAQARQRDADAAGAFLVADEVGDDAVDPREVGARQRGERDFVVAGAAQAFAHHRAHLLLRALAHRARDHPGLAEATAARAPAEDLDVQPVVDDLDERHELLLRIRPVAEVGDRALVDDARARRRSAASPRGCTDRRIRRRTSRARTHPRSSRARAARRRVTPGRRASTHR